MLSSTMLIPLRQTHDKLLYSSGGGLLSTAAFPAPWFSLAEANPEAFTPLVQVVWVGLNPVQDLVS